MAGQARGQVGGSLELQSDYRFRGISLTDLKPAASFSLAYDHSSGLYVGGSAVATEQRGPRMLGYIEYIGFATPKTAGPSFDVGVDNQNLSEFAYRHYPLRYTEAYVGVIGEHLSGHVYYSPDYLRPGANTLYADLSGVIRPSDDWRLFAHVGALTPLGGGPDVGPRRERYDLRAGIARQFRNFEIQAALTATSPAPPAQTPQGQPAIVLGANYFF